MLNIKLNSRTIFRAMIALLVVTSAMQASASSIAQTDDFYRFYDFINKNLNGGLAVGIAFTAFLVGGGIGVMKSSALPMLSGLVIAAFFAFGPNIILKLIAGSAVIHADLLPDIALPAVAC